MAEVQEGSWSSDLTSSLQTSTRRRCSPQRQKEKINKQTNTKLSISSTQEKLISVSQKSSIPDGWETLLGAIQGPKQGILSGEATRPCCIAQGTQSGHSRWNVTEEDVRKPTQDGVASLHSRNGQNTVNQLQSNKTQNYVFSQQSCRDWVGSSIRRRRWAGSILERPAWRISLCVILDIRVSNSGKKKIQIMLPLGTVNTTQARGTSGRWKTICRSCTGLGLPWKGWPS